MVHIEEKLKAKIDPTDSTLLGIQFLPNLDNKLVPVPRMVAALGAVAGTGLSEFEMAPPTPAEAFRRVMQFRPGCPKGIQCDGVGRQRMGAKGGTLKYTVHKKDKKSSDVDYNKRGHIAYIEEASGTWRVESDGIDPTLVAKFEAGHARYVENFLASDVTAYLTGIMETFGCVRMKKGVYFWPAVSVESMEQACLLISIIRQGAGSTDALRAVPFSNEQPEMIQTVVNSAEAHFEQQLIALKDELIALGTMSQPNEASFQDRLQKAERIKNELAMYARLLAKDYEDVVTAVSGVERLIDQHYDGWLGKRKRTRAV
jgi:hypothetical protein